MIHGSQLQTKESFLYGRFETLMRPSFGSGVVSSFFLFYDGADFKANWNEIDFEFLGKNTNSIDTNVIKTVNGKADNNINVAHTTLNERSSDQFWKLTIEWTPDKVVWKVNDIIVREKYIQLKNRMKIMMNIWVGNPNWAGELNSGLLPQQATYDLVRYSEYKDGRFEEKWHENFKTLDEKRWYKATHVLGNTQLDPVWVSIKNNKLVLNLK